MKFQEHKDFVKHGIRDSPEVYIYLFIFLVCITCCIISMINGPLICVPLTLMLPALYMFFIVRTFNDKQCLDNHIKYDKQLFVTKISNGTSFTLYRKTIFGFKKLPVTFELRDGWTHYELGSMRCRYWAPCYRFFKTTDDVIEYLDQKHPDYSNYIIVEPIQIK